MKRKHLESILSRLKLYSDLPEKDLNISLEQYRLGVGSLVLLVYVYIYIERERERVVGWR